MSVDNRNTMAEILREHEADLLSDWLKEQSAAVSGTRLQTPAVEAQNREQSREFLRLLRQAVQSNGNSDIMGAQWGEMRQMLTSLSRFRGEQGFSPAETAVFVFSFKKPLFDQLRKAYGTKPDVLAQQTWVATEMLDRLGLYTTEMHQKAREDVIRRQQQEMLELSTPVVKLWEGVLALPLIGTLDSARTQVVMESLLEQIVTVGATIAIIDITGVPTVDTLVAQHLLKTVAAARLMGADCIISGIRPQIAQTIVHLGVELGGVTTKATLADAFQLALKRMGSTITRMEPGRA